MEYFVFLILFIAISSIIYSRLLARQRERFISAYRFPGRIGEKLSETYPHLSETDVKAILRGLKEYFAICNMSKLKFVSMPSQAVDVAWHEFILFTREYNRFCKQAFGRFLHHTPAEAMKTAITAQDGIKRAWQFSCKREKILPRQPDRLPLLFAIDSNLKIPDGFKYTLNCSARNNSEYCAGHIGCGGGCGGSGCGGDGGGCGGD